MLIILFWIICGAYINVFLQILVVNLLISFTVTALVLAQLHDCFSGSEVNLNDVIKLNHIQPIQKHQKKHEPYTKVMECAHWNRNIVMLATFFTDMTVPKVIKVDNFWYIPSDKILINMTFLFQCCIHRNVSTLKKEPSWYELGHHWWHQRLS